MCHICVCGLNYIASIKSWVQEKFCFEGIYHKVLLFVTILKFIVVVQNICLCSWYIFRWKCGLYTERGPFYRLGVISIVERTRNSRLE